MKLLIAEDDVSLKRVLVSILQKNNYSVDAVDNGIDALDYLETGLYDGAILDIMMPSLDGISVLITARNKKIMTPVLFLTAKAEVEDKIAGLDAGASDYLTKPFDTRELLARVRALLRKTENSETNILTLENTSLNTEKFDLFTPYGNYQLTSKEYQIVLLFMQNANKIISSNTLIEKIWNFESDIEDNTVWTYISYIRKKLDALHSTLKIRTIRGSGYMLEVEYEKR